MAANDRQEGGDHYQQLNGGIQPWDVVIAWGLGFLDGNALKYLARWRRKGGIEDLKKARHYLDKQIEELEKTATQQTDIIHGDERKIFRTSGPGTSAP